MKAVLAAIMVTTLGVQAFPAQARIAAAPKVAPEAVSTDDLPLTPRFATLLTGYRNCVLREVDQSVPLSDQKTMAQRAMSACALARGELRTQLLSDIRAQKPQISPALAQRAARTGLDQLDPMIEQAAVDWAHMRYARDMY